MASRWKSAARAKYLLSEYPSEFSLKELPLLIDSNGYITISALENVGMEALKLEIVRLVKDNSHHDPMSLPEGWYRSE